MYKPLFLSVWIHTQVPGLTYKLELYTNCFGMWTGVWACIFWTAISFRSHVCHTACVGMNVSLLFALLLPSLAICHCVLPLYFTHTVTCHFPIRDRLANRWNHMSRTLFSSKLDGTDLRWIPYRRHITNFIVFLWQMKANQLMSSQARRRHKHMGNARIMSLIFWLSDVNAWSYYYSLQEHNWFLYFEDTVISVFKMCNVCRVWVTSERV